MVGIIGEHLWSDEGSESHGTVGSVSQEYDLSEQSAYRLFEATPDGQYLASDVIYTVPFETYRTRARAGDLVVVAAERDGLVRYSLREAKVVADVVQLVRLGDDVPPTDNAAERPVGLMIGFYRPVRGA